jgi:hypothetical protein
VAPESNNSPPENRGKTNNGTRLHSTLGYKTPAEHEEQGKIRKVA